MNYTPSQHTSILKRSLYKQYVKGPHAQHNKDRIDWVMKNVYKKQISHRNTNEEKVLARLSNHGVWATTQTPIPILSQGGRIEHLYLADIIADKTIIEVDGPQHLELLEYDEERDRLTALLGYKTIRIPTKDLSNETIDNYLKELWKM